MIVFAPDSIEWVVAYLGAIWAGGVAIGVNPRLAMTELAPFLAESEIRFLWCEADSVATLTPVLPVLAKAPTLVVGDDGTSDWAAALTRAIEPEPVLQEGDAPALWIGTSGTTGASKGVIHAQRMALQPHSFACGIMGLSAADRLYASSKLFFAYALGNSLFAGLRAGATVILDRQWPDPARVLAMVAQHRPTLVFCVPTLYSKMLQLGVAQQLAVQGIRHFISAGEALPVSVRRAWRDATGLGIVSGYGTSETLCLMLCSLEDDGLLQPTPGTELRFAPGMAELPGYRRPRWVHWVDALPLTATGKLQRARLVTLHQAALAANSVTA